MEKLGRFLLLTVFYILLVTLSLLVVPSICWLFGGEFLEVLQNPMYLIVMGIFVLFLWGAIFRECFDDNFKSKK